MGRRCSAIGETIGPSSCKCSSRRRMRELPSRPRASRIRVSACPAKHARPLPFARRVLSDPLLESRLQLCIVATAAIAFCVKVEAHRPLRRRPSISFLGKLQRHGEKQPPAPWTHQASLASCVIMNLSLLSLGWLTVVPGACLVAGCVDDPRTVGQGGSGGSSTAGKGGASSAGEAGGESTAGNSGGESGNGEAGEGGSAGSAEAGGSSGSGASTGGTAEAGGTSGSGASTGGTAGESGGSAGKGGISGTSGSGALGGSGGWTGTTSSIPLSSYLPTTPTCSSTGGTGGTGDTAGAGGSSGVAGSTGGTAGAAAGSGGTFEACYNYDSTAQTVTVIGREFIQFPLPRQLSVGESVVVHVTGTNRATTGLRSWLVDSSQVTSSNMALFTGQSGSTVPPASFTLDYTLTVTSGTPGLLFFKAPTPGGIIQNVTFLTVTVTL
jgi:hypothetical protein